MVVRYCSEDIFVIGPREKKTERSPMGHNEPNRALPTENTPMHLKSCPQGSSQSESLFPRRENSISLW